MKDPGRSTSELMKRPSVLAVPELKNELSHDKVRYIDGHIGVWTVVVVRFGGLDFECCHPAHRPTGADGRVLRECVSIDCGHVFLAVLCHVVASRHCERVH